MNNLKFTLKAWPVIATITFGVCFFTQQAAGLFGIELPNQANLEIVRGMMGWNWRFAFLVLQILVIMPVIEELIFRLPVKALWKLPGKFIIPFAVLLSALFSAAHYIAQPFPDAAFLALFFFGMAQTYLYKKTGAIVYPILNHTLFNLTNLVLLFIFPEAA